MLSSKKIDNPEGVAVICFAPEEVAHVARVPLGLFRAWVSLLSSHLSAQAPPRAVGIWVFVRLLLGDCHARTAHAMRSFECRLILKPYFWPLLTSFWFHTGVFLASYAFAMWHI